MSEDLSHEIEAINSIYGDHTFQKPPNDQEGIYTLSLPQPHSVTLRICFSHDYPHTAPQILGTESIGASVPKGHGNRILVAAKAVLSRVFAPGQVCLFDLIQELESELNLEPPQETPPPSRSLSLSPPPPPSFPPPTWTLSTPLTEKKSLFLARACPITSPSHAQFNIEHLLATDKRCAKATHNISAYRVRSNGIPHQAQNDDGETAAGARVLHLLQIMDVWGVLVVVSRWYGGVKLGADRFRCINTVAREAVLNERGKDRREGG